MDNIKKRIRALMEKTISNGCTEAEAISASQKVQELLHKYQLDLSDIKFAESEFRQAEYDSGMKGEMMVKYCVASISYFTDTKCWQSRDEYRNRQYVFFGMDHDVLIAEYILKIIDWAIIQGGEDFKDTSNWQLAPKNRRMRLKQDFQYGMAVRIATRLREMKDAQKQKDIKTTGRDLIVIKQPLVETAFKKLGIHLRGSKRGNRNVDPAAFNQGKAAGDKVAINPGVTKDSPVTLMR